MDQAAKAKLEAEAAAKAGNQPRLPTYENRPATGQGAALVQGQVQDKFQAAGPPGPERRSQSNRLRPPRRVATTWRTPSDEEGVGQQDPLCDHWGAVLGAGIGIGLALLLGGPLGVLMAVVLLGIGWSLRRARAGRSLG